ncbi:MAG: hypothetical protein C0184_04755 [Chloroflexus aggregans]|uniref:Uncharacterized protein n=1 Tax=Chloroflexus aggregans TaxID=152260 RepID=A0A2J6X953_9CHLR|nr:MAG: hypothetical protein C0184_04755 [Chloroflexus aggregans]
MKPPLATAITTRRWFLQRETVRVFGSVQPPNDTVDPLELSIAERLFTNVDIQTHFYTEFASCA